ncbi:hypothetical protein AUEXF2481DRAFT_90589 [Aureobasidium subglaciale EXF-2481]|uniref:Zn(2)-C6 fungal-type domain-containing protein n=1 Tax=Aureobasidium subglaciale (strain EXF-2481) TaxID=1043005 RepID=A0A074Y6I3_AURSE|nr:uncharacterized protein AUEXF2481DRAFT_90589 [Aureobasidium subglaciale EXF-2481]KAI5199634.1 hypothetical protein E4T38_06929 [Aureobasidium subglaciale]KAI5218490.1 hypothetical protein E4T40_06860 [Aureobasidium subglaciale]KAI5222161.1 hypothetical protein E4T41_06780 [Aureobasidium subglaciale]KAI5259657.1 hypothetical protein E4T46_06758 [Aureobasidium subglaciale]KEQ93388.1 hypothetical protein AUEXF2481DRAFT_90589 [Aureobasidium subglaciale EXF-2481]
MAHHTTSLNLTAQESISFDTDDGNNPRKRQRTACDRCKGRKQKCDNAFPQCTNCAKAGRACNKPPDTEALDNPYTRALEDQVAHLEKQLAAMSNLQRRRSSTIPGASLSSPINHERSPGLNMQCKEVGGAQRLTPSGSHGVNIADVVGMLSLGSGNAEYVGSSSGYALATDLGRMVQATVWNKAMWLPTSLDSGMENRPTSADTRKITLQELQSRQAKPISDALGTRLIDAYLVRIHPRFPFLFPADLRETHRRQNGGLAGDDQSGVFASSAYNDEGFSLFMLNMVYSIGALNLRLTDQGYRDTPPEQFYLSAMQHVASVREASSVDNLQALVLLILYHLRSESRNGLWHLTGLAMRTVTDIGLHRAASTRNLPPLKVQLRRRLFWSVYALESILAGALGRPISLSDYDIDQPLPVSISDGDCMQGQDTHSTDYPVIPGREAYPQTNMSQFILLSQLRRFEARIQRTIYRVDRPISALQPKMYRLITELDAWRQNIPSDMPSSERERLMLHYHRDVRLLLQPFLSMLEPGSGLFRRCVDAAGQVCQIHKRLHQTPEYGHSFVAVHTVFVSGITLLYALWKGSIWSFSISNDIRAASCVLAIMGERAPWIRRFRDEFDNLTEATMTALQNAESDQVGDDMDRQVPAPDFTTFDDLDITDVAALEMVRELSEWFQS